ncbi:hypothetical protein V5799_013879 [Amblyomma americanum]|uniref:Tick transposon n=1 Tax=Amblyomma americanum TaxID=6943 RepID=A0AAQ4E4M4_AMBAM
MMEYAVEGEDISPEDVSEDTGWKINTQRNSTTKARLSYGGNAVSPNGGPGPKNGKGSTNSPSSVKKGIIRRGKMPPLPKNDIKIIVRIRGGLNIAKIGAAALADAITAAACIDELKREADTICPNYQQNIVVVRTPEEENATKYLRIKELCIAGDTHAAAAYRAAPHETCKGIIRNIPLSEGPEALSRKIVNPRNPLALAAKRIKESGTVIIAFNLYKVPKYVRADMITVLGVLIESNGANTLTIQKIISKTENAVRLVKRVANRQTGLKEDSLIRFMHAFVLCHFTYVAAMHKWKPSEKKKLDTQIRKITKKVLGVPLCTSNDRLLQLGIHITLDEIAEAQDRTQMVRLSTTSAGRQILRELGVPQEKISQLDVGIPLKVRQRYEVKPVLRNMHPEQNVGRRKPRGACLLRLIRDENQKVGFVDASFNEERKVFTVVVVDNEGSVVNAATVRTDRPEVAEQAAIALSLVDRRRPFVYSDSMSAVRAFEKGSVAKVAFKIM